MKLCKKQKRNKELIADLSQTETYFLRYLGIQKFKYDAPK